MYVAICENLDMYLKMMGLEKWDNIVKCSEISLEGFDPTGIVDMV